MYSSTMTTDLSKVRAESQSDCDVVFAILAHNKPESLAEQLNILMRFAPTSKCLVFDASPYTNVCNQLGLVPCAGSRPLEYGRLAPFHLAAMRAAEELRNYEFLITLDSDMLLIRSGIVDYLRRVMRSAEYMASHFREVSCWLRSDSHRRFRYCWRPYWQELLGASRPYRVLNCFQVFRRTLVERFLTHPRIDEIIEATMPQRTALVALEEIVYPTLAVSLGAQAITYPGSYTIDTSPVSMSNLSAFRHDPNVIFVHSGVRDVTSAPWQFVRALSLGIECEAFDDEKARMKRTLVDRARTLVDRAVEDARVLSAIARGARY